MSQRKSQYLPIKGLGIGAAGLVLSACVTTSITGETPALESSFLETELAANRYRIAYFGNSAEDRESVEDHLLYRAAELTLDKGYDYFSLSKEDVEHRPLYDAVTCPVETGHISHDFESQYRGFPYYAYGFDWAGPCDADVTPYSALTFVTMYKPETPQYGGNSFIARKVLKDLGPSECWEKESHDHAKCKLVYP